MLHKYVLRYFFVFCDDFRYSRRPHVTSTKLGRQRLAENGQ